MVLRVDADRLRADFDALARDRRDAGRRRRAHDVLRGAPRRPGLVPRARAGGGARDAGRLGRQPLGRPAGPRPGRAHAAARLASRFGPQRRPLRRRPRRRLRARGAPRRQGRRARPAGRARGDRLHRRGGDADRHARQPARSRAGSHAEAPRCAARRPRASRRRARADGARPRTACCAARRDPATLAGYLELHIEQGPVLERAGVDIGIVTGITGASSFRVVFEGEARHAGTTPMDARRDAAVGAAAFVLGRQGDRHARLSRVRRDGRGHRDGAGLVQRRPRAGAAAARVPLARRRASSTRSSGRSSSGPTRQPRRSASTSPSSASAARSRRRPTTSVRAAFAAAAAALGLTTLELPSGAGHDAQSLAAITPSGMVFVPSVGGVSHDPAEHTAWEDCVNGANVLLGAARSSSPSRRRSRSGPDGGCRQSPRVRDRAARRTAEPRAPRGARTRAAISLPGRRSRAGARRARPSGTRRGRVARAGTRARAGRGCGRRASTSPTLAGTAAQALEQLGAPTRGRGRPRSPSRGRRARGRRGRALPAPAAPSSRGRARAGRRCRTPNGRSASPPCARGEQAGGRDRRARDRPSSTLRGGAARRASPPAPPAAHERDLARRLGRRPRAGDPGAQLGDPGDRVTPSSPWRTSQQPITVPVRPTPPQQCTYAVPPCARAASMSSRICITWPRGRRPHVGDRVSDACARRAAGARSRRAGPKDG